MTYETTLNEAIATNLAQWRSETGTTQKQLAQWLGAIFERPIPVMTVYRMERGERAFSAAEVMALTEMMGTTPKRLCGIPEPDDALANQERARVLSDHLHRAIRLLQGTRVLVQEAGLAGQDPTQIPFTTLSEALRDADA